jgi:hypothetical protein
MGMHAHWASALSLLLAEKANGLVFPTTFACFAGATRTFRGTVSFPIHEQVSVLKRIASGLHAAGFKRTVLEQMRTLALILTKHGVFGAPREALLKSHGIWFGKPIHIVQAELDKSVRQLRYRVCRNRSSGCIIFPKP